VRITNNSNLPAPLVAAVSHARRPLPDRISVTELIGPPQIRRLQLRHWDEIEEDASDRIWATMGTLMHKLLESHAEIERHISERTLATTVEVDGAGFVLSGTFDLYHEDGILFDYKFVSVWTTMDGLKDEWVQQLNCYAELLRREGAEVSRLQIVAIYRDWSKGKANDPSYPSSQVQTFDVPLWSSERTSAFMSERMRLHLAAEDGETIECSPEERWERPTKFALMKRGQKRAVKLFDDNQTALSAVQSAGFYVEKRPGVSVRCASYCRVAAFCPQYARLRSEAQGEENTGGGDA
jgi:hypothetical protein